MVNEIHSDANSRMTKSLHLLRMTLVRFVLEELIHPYLNKLQLNIMVHMVPLSQVSNISAEDSRTLKVSPWEKDMVGPIEKAIMTSDLGLNPNTKGQVLRIPLPPSN